MQTATAIRRQIVSFPLVLLTTNLENLASDVLYHLDLMAVILGPEETVIRLAGFKDKKFKMQNIWEMSAGQY